MILPSEQAPEPLPNDYALCIVGAGAAGITLACEMDGCGQNVLLLEAGGLAADEAASRDHYAGSAGAPHPDPALYRRTGLGGTTALWGGRCVPLDPVDFESREWVPHSGWPISWTEVARHYPRAMAYCEAGQDDFSVEGSLPAGLPTLPGLRADDPDLLDRIERYSLPTHFGRSYRSRLARSANVTVLLHARCVDLERAPGQPRVQALVFVDRQGRRRRVSAARFVLATGGIETARLLLCADNGKGLGNEADLVGRYYMCHFESVCARLTTGGRNASFAFERTRDGIYARRKLQFSQDTLQRQRLLNSVFRLHFPDYADASHRSGVLSAIFLLKSMLVPEYRGLLQHGRDTPLASAWHRHLRNVLFDLDGVLGFGWTWLFGRVLARRKLPYTLIRNADGSYPIEFNSEQLPRAVNRVRLDGPVDTAGVPRVRVDWRLDGSEIDAAYAAFRHFRDAVSRSTPCRVEFEDGDLRQTLAQSVPVGGHHIGTARMASSPRTGVVDADAAVFGAPNLFIASSAVFPTSGHANPTLTIVALALRLADHLKALSARA